MLHEISNVKQKPQNKYRRWFTDYNMDLFVWFSAQSPIGFQLSYNKQTNEKAMCWESEKGFQHYSVDNGEVEPLKYKMSPLYSDDADFDTFVIAREFLRNSDHIEATLADFIYARLLEYPGSIAKHSSQGAASSNYE